jgi:hypothetical protein
LQALREEGEEEGGVRGRGKRRREEVESERRKKREEVESERGEKERRS